MPKPLHAGAPLPDTREASGELNETLEERGETGSLERLRIWNVSEDLFAVADLEGRYLSVNPAWTSALGWSASDLLGRSSEWLLHPDDQERSRAETRRVAAGTKSRRFESRFRHKDGSYRWISWKAVRDRSRIYAVGRDVTELEAAEDRLRKARHELTQVTRRTTLATMTASIAHEINQPLAAIVSNADASLLWLEASAPDLDEVRTAMEHIVQNGHRASEILANIRGQFRRDGQERTALNVNHLVRDVLALTQVELESHRVGVHTELREDVPEIVGQRVPLQQVLLNLIMNAVEAMSSLTDRMPQLGVRTVARESTAVLITVTDCGVGIDPGNMHSIFEPFFTTKPQGMGMGLSICRSIVEAHGGRLWAAPGTPHGSIFHVQLPTGG